MKKYLFLLMLGAMVTACKDLDLPPTSELTFDLADNSTSNLEGILNGGYGRMMQALPGPAANASYFDLMLYAEAMAAKNTFISPLAGAGEVTFQFHNFIMQPNNAQLASLSRNLYATATLGSTVIELVNKGTTPDADFPVQKDRLLGEAHFLRGMAYFLSVRLWGHQFGHNSAADGGGIMTPLERSKDGTVGVPRTAVAANYTQIISDLTEAVRLLPANYDGAVHGNFPAYRFRATKAVALSMLARAYFQQGNRDGYQKALEAINRVIGNVPGTVAGTPETGNRVYALQTDVKVPFSSSGFVTASTNTEEIFRLVNNTTNTAGYTAASQNISNTSGGNPANLGATRWMLRRPASLTATTAPVTTSPLFDEVVNDRRFTELTQNIVINNVGNQRVSRKWGFLAATQVGFLNCPAIRSAELVITRAEINAVLGNTAAALADYNLIRRRAITGYTDRTLASIGTGAVAGTAAALVAEIVRERQREMLFEGDDFWSWKRMGAYNAANPGTYPAAEVAPVVRSNVTLNWNSNKTLLKWHNDDLTLNPQLGTSAQNPD
jgi:starch-binding outer membrane protein, SusD/RagB family